MKENKKINIFSSYLVKKSLELMTREMEEGKKTSNERRKKRKKSEEEKKTKKKRKKEKKKRKRYRSRDFMQVHVL